MKSKKRILAYICAIIMIMAMALIYNFKQQNEYYIPEIATLAIGLFLLPHQVWETPPKTLIFLTMVYSSLGAIVANTQLPIVVQIPLVFFLCAYGLWRSHTAYTPLIAIAILPIMFQTASIVYPLLMTSFAVILEIMQSLLIKIHALEPQVYTPVQFDEYAELVLFGKRFLVIVIFSLFDQLMSTPLLFAPPIFMAFYEMSGSEKLRDRSLSLYIVAIFMAFVGAYLRYFLCVQQNLSLLFVIGFTVIVLIMCQLQFEIFYPPIGAICLLPMIIDESLLLLYPCFVSVGMILSIFASYYIAYKKDEDEEEELLNEE